MIFARLERDAFGFEQRRHVRVASNRLRFVIVIGEHCIHIQRLRELRNRVACLIVNHMQRTAHCLKCSTQLDHTFPDKFNAAIRLVNECVKDFAIKHEHAMHALGVGQRGVQRSIVKRPQIAAKPEQSGGVLHVRHFASAAPFGVRLAHHSLANALRSPAAAHVELSSWIPVASQVTS